MLSGILLLLVTSIVHYATLTMPKRQAFVFKMSHIKGRPGSILAAVSVFPNLYKSYLRRGREPEFGDRLWKEVQQISQVITLYKHEAS